MSLFDPPSEATDDVTEAPVKLSPKEFCQRILDSPEFRAYLTNGIQLGTLPAAVIVRIMDLAWGKPVDRIEHTGKDGEAIITEVRRVVVRPEDTHLAQEQTNTSKSSIH